jgi:hypothetical protein
MRNSWLALFAASATAAHNELMRLSAQEKINSLLTALADRWRGARLTVDADV